MRTIGARFDAVGFRRGRETASGSGQQDGGLTPQDSDPATSATGSRRSSWAPDLDSTPWPPDPRPPTAAPETQSPDSRP
jgi:hypothetical protein